MSISVRDIDHVVLRVTDIEKSIAFYEGVLGLEVKRARDEIGLYQLQAGRSMVDLIPVLSPIGQQGGAGPGEEGRNMDHFCLRLDEFDEAAIHAALDAAGVVYGETGMRFGAEGTGPSIYIQDPDGNTVELKGPPQVSTDPPASG